MNRFVCGLIALFFMAMVLLPDPSQAARKTRDLVFEEEEETSANAAQETAGKQSVAIKTTVVLTRDGQTTTVAPSHDFKTGDKVKLVFTPSTDGYVYWLAKGSSGQYSMLYPSPKAGADNQVKRNVEYTVPARGSFKFDATPGKEELLCILSTERMPDLDQAAEEQFKNAGQHIAELENKNTSKRKTRDLVFEEEEEDDVSTKKQEAAAGEPLVAHFELNHN